MAEENRAETIKAWQQKLEATFDRKYLASVLAAERATGAAFMGKWRGRGATWHVSSVANLLARSQRLGEMR
jgi:hypothetical protein